MTVFVAALAVVGAAPVVYDAVDEWRRRRRFAAEMDLVWRAAAAPDPRPARPPRPVLVRLRRRLVRHRDLLVGEADWHEQHAATVRRTACDVDRQIDLVDAAIAKEGQP